MTYLFKKGDIIVLTNDFNKAAKKGAKAIVTQDYYTYQNYVYLKWIRDSLSNGQGDGGYFPKDFKIAKIDWRDRLK
jgi:signal peptidase I